MNTADNYNVNILQTAVTWFGARRCNMKTERDKYAEQFADYMVEAMARTGMKQTQIASAASISRQMVSQIVGKKPHTLTGKLTLPAREIVDRIAKAFGDPVAVARRAAGYSVEEQAPAEPEPDSAVAAARRAAELVENFLTLSQEKQTQILALIRVMQADHPELLEMMKPPIKIVRAEDLTESDAERDTG